MRFVGLLVYKTGRASVTFVDTGTLVPERTDSSGPQRQGRLGSLHRGRGVSGIFFVGAYYPKTCSSSRAFALGVDAIAASPMPYLVAGILRTLYDRFA
eukprot:2289775-Rhodomonas_salina.1